jgi:hypothetical protein
MARIDWAKALDLPLAGTNVRGEFIGDWYRDPWGWPELGYVLSNEPQLVVDNLATTGARRAALIDVPKENWGSRPAVVLDILDRLTYQSLVDRLSVDLIGTMSPAVYGWRLPPGTPKRGEYSHNNLQWDGYRSHLGLATAFFDVALKTDLVSCFASISLDLVRDGVDDKAPQGAIAQRLISLLDGFDRIPERSGLPQRSLASAVLANMVLGPLDDVLEHFAVDVPSLKIFGKTRLRARHRSWSRWMDDMWLFGSEAAHMRRAQTEMQDVARSLGLNINSAKTDVLEGDDVSEEALQIEHSAVDNALKNRNDHKPLEELVDKLLDVPESASRTSLKFVVKRMRDQNSRYRIQEFAALAERMPHAADALAPLFKEAFLTGSLQDWFLDYAESEWAAFQWSVAQYVRMFTSNRAPKKAMREFVAQRVDDADSSLPLLAVSAQRLAAWDPAEARAVTRAALARTSHPLNRRALALAALGAGESRGTVRKWLKQEPENDVTLRMLEHFNFGPPKIGANYAN